MHKVWPTWRPRLIWGLPTLFSCAVCLFLFYPGLMSFDSYAQWTEAHSWRITSWHSPAHTICIALLTKLADTPLSIAIVQSLALALLFGWAASIAVKISGRIWLGWTIALFPVIAVQNALMAITVWKDVPFSLALAAVTVMLGAASLSPHFLATATDGIIFGLLLSAVVLFRSNGFLPAVVAAAVLLGLRRLTRVSVAGIVTATLVIATLEGPVYHVLKVDPAVQPALAWPSLHVIAAHMAQGTPLQPDELSLLSEARPLDKWSYRCDTMSALDDEYLNSDFVAAHTSELFHLALRLSARRPRHLASHLLCFSSFLWSPLAWKHHEPESFAIQWRADKSLGEFDYPVYGKFNLNLPERLAISRRLPLSSFIGLLHYPGAEAFFTRPALWLYAWLAPALILAIRRRSVRPMLHAAPIVVNAAVLAVAAPVQALRYFYYIMPASACLTPLLWWQVVPLHYRFLRRASCVPVSLPTGHLNYR